MGLINEFKQFAVRGNVVDLAVGVVIGAAFGKIVTALVDKVIMPPVGLLIGGVDFSQWKWVLAEATAEQPEVAIAVGDFINTIIQFTIIAFTIFLVIKAMNRMVRKEAAPAPPPAEVQLLTEIRDLLKARTGAT
jgi:large conductance mechanosensitive channel